MSDIEKRVAGRDEIFMQLALDQAVAALSLGEFPVGCVIVQEGRVVSRGARRGTFLETGRRTIVSEVDHAEIRALRQLETCPHPVVPEKCIVYSTMEPCLMCFGAIVLSGIKRIVYAFEDPMGGGTACELTSLPPLYKKCGIQVKSGVCRRKSLDLFFDFFNKRDNRYWKDSFLEQYVRDQRKRSETMGG
ncbi:MAG: nucleoside deaminase [Desulfotignum sp.]|nr:nucleoside deaminase [Desulfotignum sp.]